LPGISSTTSYRATCAGLQTVFKPIPFYVDSSVKTGINITLDDPSAIGADRLVDAAAVQVIYGGPACIVDFGTATTFDVLDNKGNYLGGAIAPGIGISADALFQRTSKLPRFDLVRPPSVTERTPFMPCNPSPFGYVSMVEGKVARIQKTTGDDLKVIGTGGLAEMSPTRQMSSRLLPPG
jgi:type III pantothenate kinase